MEVYDNSYIPTEFHGSSEVLDSLWIPSSSSPTSFQGTSSMVNFEVETSEHPDRRFDSDLDLHPRAEKKRRLKASQVKFLEKSFEADNKLEPDRKIELAKELGLQPRQVAIWFQNRRARYKTKFLEKEYDSLKTSYDNLKKDYDSLFADNHKLQQEVQSLMQKLESEVKEEPKKQEENGGASSSKSEVFDTDADSPHYYNQSKCNWDENVMQSKLEMEHFLMPNSCGLGYPIQNQIGTTWFWQC